MNNDILSEEQLDNLTNTTEWGVAIVQSHRAQTQRIADQAAEIEALKAMFAGACEVSMYGDYSILIRFDPHINPARERLGGIATIAGCNSNG